MAHDLTHAEVQGLLAVYALDAVDADEREAVERHLVGCGLCRIEVMEHLEMAGLLSSGLHGVPPSVWDRIAEEVAGTPPPLDMAPIHALGPIHALRPAPDGSGPVESSGGGSGPFVPAGGSARPGGASRPGGRRSDRRGAGVRIGALVAAATVAASTIGVLGLKVVEDGRRIDRITVSAHGDELGRAINAAVADPDVVKVEMRSPDGALFADAWMLPDGHGYLARTNLPDLNPTRGYQLWAVVGDKTISLGLLGSGPEPSAFVADGPVTALAITDEVAGGVQATAQQPVVVGKITPS